MTRLSAVAATVAASLAVASAFSPAAPSLSLSTSSRLCLAAPCASAKLPVLRRAAAVSTLRMQQFPREDGLSPLSGGGFSSKGEAPFQIRGFSLGNLTLLIGTVITFSSFYSYFTNGNSLSALGFIYGIPIALGGFALKYAEILPVPVISDTKGDAIWEEKANDILKKVKEDVTRHRYGDDAHLDSTLNRLGLVMEGKGFPQLVSIEQKRERGVEGDGELAFIMTFQSQDTPYKVWADPARVRKYESFFGGLNAEVLKVSKEERLVAIKLTTGLRKGTGAIEATNEAISVGGGTKMGAEMEAAPEPVVADAESSEAVEKRSMDV
eukprot:CAMPEP_0180158366 /NCGR_PEP_ID=MMETSP0986-20121125/26856_1 /TAXON_ID=697907 /ORGANISM="non described non described, Strain CCMP2293" /LENGTH=323 /DNA_ID=CAMNT_0022108187 /DNA_START=63 /DNA_END=1034 /DNA_ORIENTATION=-